METRNSLSGAYKYMELKKPAMAGTTESSDCMVMISPNPAGGIVFELDSNVKVLFGASIEKTVREVLASFEVTSAAVSVIDKGALDFVIRARTECAVCRAAEISYDWSREDKHGN